MSPFGRRRSAYLPQYWHIGLFLTVLVTALFLFAVTDVGFRKHPKPESKNPASFIADQNTPSSMMAKSSVQGLTSGKMVETPPPLNKEGYLGPESCAGCHAERVSEFRQTRHFQACLPTPVDRMPSGFLPGRGKFVPPGSSIEFVMSRDGDQFLQTAIQNNQHRQQRTSSPIGLVYGSGAGTDEVYFTWQGHFLSELPMCWLTPINDWGVSSFDRDGSGDFARPTTPRCVECHNTWMSHVPGSVNEYKNDQSIYGITCEVCHGPGRDHVFHHKAHPEESSAVAIVHPGELSRERRMDLCAQCHSNAMKHRGPAFQYRPGRPLDDHYKTLQTKYPEDDHVANQVSYLRESKCFQRSEQMTCVTCHDPHAHQPRNQRGAGGATCYLCHQATECTAREDLPIEVQENCVGCHMPKGEKIQVNFLTREMPYYAPVPRWEHRIGVYPIARDEILLEWYSTQTDQSGKEQVLRLTESLLGHWRERIELYASQHRHLAAIHACRMALRLRPDSSVEKRLSELLEIYTRSELGRPKIRHLIAEGHYDAAFNLAQEILALKPNDAITRGNLGTLYAVRGDKDRAREQWSAAAKLDIDDPYGPSMLGWQAYLDGKYEESIEQFLVAESIEPYFDKINYQLGLALFKLERWDDAVHRFERVLKINPRHLEGHFGLNSALRKTGQVKAALAIARSAANLSREQNLTALQALAETYGEAGDFANAVRTARKMIELAQKQEPRRVPEIHKWIDEWHAAEQQGRP